MFQTPRDGAGMRSVGSNRSQLQVCGPEGNPSKREGNDVQTRSMSGECTVWGTPDQASTRVRSPTNLGILRLGQEDRRVVLVKSNPTAFSVQLPA